MYRKASYIVFIFLPIILLSISCNSKESSNQRNPKIGVILSLTGPADFIGTPEKDVLLKLLDDYNSRNHNTKNVVLDIVDSGGNPANATTLFNRFLNDQDVLAIIGPSTSGESLPVAEEAFKNKLPVLSLAASKKIVFRDGKTNPWVFKFAQNDDLASTRILSTIINQKQHKIAFLYSNDSFGKGGFESFVHSIKDLTNQYNNNGIVRLEFSSAFPSDLDSPEPYVEALPNGLDAIIIWGTAPGPALLIKAIKSYGIKSQIYLSHGNASSSFIESTGVSSENSIIIGSRVLTEPDKLDASNKKDKVIISFQEFWNANFSGNPSHFGGHARDALTLLMNILPEIDFSKDIIEQRQQIRDKLNNTQNFMGVTGVFNFNENDHAGLGIDAFETYKIINNKFTVLR